MGAEAPKWASIVDGERQLGTYASSLLETAFATEIERRFVTPLQEAHFSPDRRRGQIWREIYEEDRIGDVVNQAHGGRIDYLRLLTDPSYCVPGATVSQWPECFQFVLFDADNSLTLIITPPKFLEPSPISPGGKFHGSWPDVHGYLVVPASFEGVAHDHLGRRQRGLIVSFPRRWHELTRAHSLTHNRWMHKQGYDVDSVEHFPTAKNPEIPIFPGQDQPKKIMAEIVELVRRLTKPSE